jgi:putative chitinase
MSTETVAAKMGAGKYAEPLERACIQFGVATPLEKSHLLAQVAHESDGFATATEYASGARYEGRKDLGNTKPGDGKRFKGRGLIQCTGRDNYASYSAWKYRDDRCVKKPEMVAELPDAVDVALWFWCVRKPSIRALAAKDDIVGVTKKVNGGTNGLEDRKKRLAQAKALFGISS